MKRVQLFEFEDYTWLPDWIRSSMTRLIVVMHRLLGTKKVLVPLLERIQQKQPFQQIVDMGAGSGGVMPTVLQAYNEGKAHPTQLLLTDLHPSAEYRRAIEQQQLPHVRYREQSLDATHLEQAPEGLKTMICSFHHLPPEAAKAVLHTAQDNRQPLMIYEIAENKVPLILWWLLLPLSLVVVFLMALIITPFARPLTIRQLLFTYLIPIIPILYAWDGQASLVRTYTFEDVKNLIGPPVEGYTWTIEAASNDQGKAVGYYILGLPA